MSESGEKTEQPTSKKLDDAKKKGQVPQSQDIHKLFITGVGFETLVAFKDRILIDINMLFTTTISQLDGPFLKSLETLAKESVFTLFKSSIFVLLFVVVARAVSSWIQFGFLIVPSAVTPNIEKLNPMNTIKQLFSMAKLVELALNIIKFGILLSVFYVVVVDSLNEIVLTSTGTLMFAITAGADVFIYAARLSLVLLAIVCVFDLMLQRKIFTKQHMMTKDEVYREYKQQEGDPHTKAQRKAFGRELVESGPAPVQAADDANVVIVNPTHFAIALRFIPGEDPLPKILCKGVDDRAKEIIARAKQNDTVIIRYVSLARELYSTGKEGVAIPRATLKPIAAVYRAVFKTIEDKEAQSTPSGMIAHSHQETPHKDLSDQDALSQDSFGKDSSGQNDGYESPATNNSNDDIEVLH